MGRSEIVWWGSVVRKYERCVCVLMADKDSKYVINDNASDVLRVYTHGYASFAMLVLCFFVCSSGNYVRIRMRKQRVRDQAMSKHSCHTFFYKMLAEYIHPGVREGNNGVNNGAMAPQTCRFQANNPVLKYQVCI